MPNARLLAAAAALGLLLATAGLVLLSMPVDVEAPRIASRPPVREAAPGRPAPESPVPAERSPETAPTPPPAAVPAPEVRPEDPPPASRSDRLVGSPAAPAGKILGQVLDPAGRPVAEARVVLSNAVGELAVPSDAAGRFGFEPLPAGHYRLRAFHPDFAPGVERAEGRWVDLSENETERVELRLERGLVVEGVVVAGDGTGPVGGARVSMVRAEYRGFLTVITRPDGCFRFDHFPRLPRGERPFPIEVTAAGFAPAYLAVEPRREEERPRLEVRLDRGAAVHGVVADADGRPLEGVSVRCKFRYRYVKAMSEITGRTDNLGRYRIDHLPRNVAIQVWAFRRGYRPTYLNLVLSEAQRDKMMRPLGLRAESRP